MTRFPRLSQKSSKSRSNPILTSITVNISTTDWHFSSTYTISEGSSSYDLELRGLTLGDIGALSHKLV